MPPALAHSSSRPWWPRSKSSKDPLRTHRSASAIVDEDEKCLSSPSTSSKPKDALPPRKFNTLASAIGFRSKKLPALTIQDPPSPRAPSHPYTNSRPGSGNSGFSSPAVVDRTPFFTNRPPAKSVSTVRSSEYDYDAASDPHSEPRTPSDHPRDRLSYQHSVMTFAEMDPFASGGIIVQALPQDPNRLSVYSDSSMLDPQQKRPDIPPPMTHRVSYGSCSSNSHGNHSDILSPQSATSFGRPPTASRSAYDLSQTSDQYFVDSSAAQSQRTRRTKTPSGSNSSNSTVTQHDYRSRLSEPPPGMHLPRKRSSPSLGRPRGLTVGAAVDHQPGAPPFSAVPDLPPLQLHRKESGSSSLSSSNTPSPSPVVFTRSRNASCTTLESPASPNSTHPKVLVRKASASRVYVPPLPAAPPTASLPPTPSRLPPLPSPYGLSPLEFRASSSSSSLDFAPSVGPHDLEPDDPISQILNDHYDLGPFQASPREASKGKTRKNHSTDILDTNSSSYGLVDLDMGLPSPLGKFPSVPTLVHGDLHPKAGKLLKKMSSQQSFSQRHSATSFMSTASGTLEDASGRGNGHPSPAKTPRKQRSFHAPRGIPLPLPPLPGLRSSSGGTSSTSEALPPPCSPVIEPRRGSIMSPRKRLFSASSARRSTSSHGPSSLTEVDDKRSIFSFESDVRPFTSSGVETIGKSFDSAGGHSSQGARNGSTSVPSLRDDGVGENGKDKRMSQSDYVPQYIMSPAEQLKLAEKLEDQEAAASIHEEVDCPTRKPTLDLQPGDFGLTYSSLPSATRSRSNSVLSHSSTGTLAFGDKSGGVTRGTSILSTRSSIMTNASRLSPANHSPRKVIIAEAVRSVPSRTTSMLAKPTSRPPPLSVRPSTAQASITPPRSPQRVCNPHTPHSPETPSASLPPPPRRRPSRHDLHDIEEATDKRASVVPINPLSPPPIRPARLRRQDSTDTTTTVMSRPPSAYDRQKALQRRSIMKKPSFLDIEDDFDQNMENGSDEEEVAASSESPTMESSFLDMDRGKNSFDTVRSCDSASHVY